ncbi:YHS domain-containing (seleno)protein [Roseivirga sp.]|uniref:YHS domain-containing (seleno)protein n=1 Tax=Roseivirga sp. TaxID=1964215 RepID=UPI003B515A4E
MKTIRRIAMYFMALTLVSQLALAQDKKAFNIDNSNIALEGYSPVSYLDLGLAQKGLKEFKSEHDKVVYYFTSAEQKQKFDKNPDKYLPQYGGYCAFGVYAGAKFRPDPNKFIVKDGKYFLYLYNLELDAQQLWLKENNHAGLVKKANDNWDKLKKTYN